MAIYEITADTIRQISETSFEEAGISKPPESQPLLPPPHSRIVPGTVFAPPLAVRYAGGN
jgi:hypothetical protein